MQDDPIAHGPAADAPAPGAACAICGAPIEKVSGDVIITTLENAVHAQCAERLAA